MFAKNITLESVKNAIKGKDEFVIKFEEETNTFVVKYNLVMAGSFDADTEEEKEILQECRGLTFDANTGKIVARKYHKFYNIGEKSHTGIDSIDFSKKHWIMDKMDGSLISNIRYSNLPVTKAGRSDVAKLADEFFQKDSYKNLNAFCSENNYTALYEFCTMKNRIVLYYEEEQMVLTAIRHNETGEYVYNPCELKEIGAKFGIPVVNSYIMDETKSIKDIIENIREAEGIEGIIIRFEDGAMYKVKSNEYIRFHNAVARVKQEKDIVSIILREELDDILPLLSKEDKEQLNNFSDEFNQGIIETVNKIVSLGQKFYEPVQKDFVMKIKNSLAESRYSPYLFPNREHFVEGNDELAKEIITSKVKEAILKASNNSTKLEEKRFLFNAHFATNKIYMSE